MPLHVPYAATDLVALFIWTSRSRCILAIRKTGGVSLDPEHPAERTQTIVRLAQTNGLDD
jgi:hypothetical protein